MSQYQDEFRTVQRDALWSLPRVFLVVASIVGSMYVLGFIATGGDLAIYRFWAPKQENAKRIVFENTQSYVQGKSEYLSRLRLQYETAEPGSTQRAALRTMLLSESATVDRAKLPPEMQAFLDSVQGSIR